MEDVGRSETLDLGLRLFFGKRVAHVSTTDVGEKALAELVDR